MEKAAAGLHANGQIPFILRVGVTGHRTLENPASVTAAVREALGQVKTMAPSLPGGGLVLVVVSALAEGADRLVAEEVLAEPGARLEAALPLPVADYLRDFDDEDSRRQFSELLGRASRTWIAPAAPSRDEAYERAGCYVVDRCDVLVALWDGEAARGRGGTAALVAYARDRNVPLMWVGTGPEPYGDSAATGPRAGVVRSAARQLREYNVGAIAAADFDARVRQQIDDFRPDLPEASHIDPLSVAVENVAAWLVPYFVRADILAIRLQRMFLGLRTAAVG